MARKGFPDDRENTWNMKTLIKESKEGTRDVRPPHGTNVFIFMQFSGKIGQNNRLGSPLFGLAP